MKEKTNIEILKRSREVAEQLYNLRQESYQLSRELESRKFTQKQEEDYDLLSLMDELNFEL